MTNCWRAFVFFWSTSSIFAEASGVCSVQPSAIVVVVGETVFLNCAATEGFSIRSWQIGLDIQNRTVVYTAQLYGRNGTLRAKKSVADGYSVTNETENKVSLYIKKIKFPQAGLYVCQCGDHSMSIATTVVVVLTSEPTFSVISSVTGGKPVSVLCSISFNGPADIASNLTIKDASGNTVNKTVCYPNNIVESCALKYRVPANASVDQLHSCSVHLSTKNITIYSRIVNTSLELQQVSSPEIVVSNPGKCSAEKCVTSETITCKTHEGTGNRIFKWWQILNNGSEQRVIGDGSQHLVLNEVGKFTYRCQAYSIIGSVTTNATSQTFTINVTNSNAYQIPTLPIAIAVGCIIITILTVATIVIYTKLRKRSASGATQISTEDSPTIYAALDIHVQTSFGENERETYTAIQLPIQSKLGLGGDCINTDFSCEYETVN